eukprot:g12882.t1.1.5e17418b g12882  g12882.t1 contig7:391214-393235(+)
MKMIGATILLALLAFRLDSGACFKASPLSFVPRECPPLSPLRVASTAWATSNDGLAPSTRTNRDSIGGSKEERRRQKAKAPLVDSTLLRFLSSQKNGSTVLLKGDNTQTKVGGTIQIDAPNGESSVEEEVPTFTTGSAFKTAEQEGVSTSTSQTTEIPSIKAIESQSWLSQYNAQRVALKLQALGVDEETALNTGKVVQDYILSRVTRRRIRKFLQERDASWESGDSMPLDRGGMKENMSSAATSNFDIDEVITVLTEYGLTGTDIAAIFSHTPNIAMMRARSTASEAMKGEKLSETASTLEDTLDKAFVGLLGETLRLRRYDARKILRTCPGLLTTKGSASAEQVVSLMVSLGSSTNAIARDKASLPTLLSRSPSLIFRLVAFLSSAQLKVPLAAIGSILRQKQSTEMLNAVAPLKETITDGGAYDEIASKNLTAMDAQTALLGYFRADQTMRQQQIEESYQSMEAVANVLRMTAGIKDFRKILSSYPHAFFLNVTNIISVATYLRDDVGMTKEDVGKAIQSFPTLLEQDVSRIRSVVEFMRSIEVDEEALPTILRSFPATLLLDTETTMIPVVEFLREIGVRNVGRFVT